MIFESMWTKRDAVSKERMAICRVCEHFNSFTNQCNQCGCFMVVKTKMLSSECPVGKWSKLDDEPTPS